MPRYWWVVALAVVLCVVAVGLVSFNSTNRFQPISYIPMERMVNLSTSEGTGGGYEFGPVPGEDGLDLFEPAPSGLTQEGKLLYMQNKYLNLFNSLNDAYRQELNRLGQSAWNDYQARKSGRLDMTVPDLVRQYTGAARSLEKQADTEFAGLVEIMKTELKTEGLPTDMVQQVEEEYERQKSETRKEMLKLAADLIND